MTTTRSVRLPDGTDSALARIAADDHISINAAIVQAVDAWIEQREHRTLVQKITAHVVAEDAGLLRRLGDA